MKELSIERMEMVSGGGSAWDCAGAVVAMGAAVFMTYTTGPLWAIAGGWGTWAAGSLATAYNCADYIVYGTR